MEIHYRPTKAFSKYFLREWLGQISGYLNVYCEPEEFLTKTERAAFEPIAFFGAGKDLPTRASTDNRLCVYISFGTAVWRAHPDVALDAFAELARVFVGEGALVRIGLGGNSDLGIAIPEHRDALTSLKAPGVSIEEYANQGQRRISL